jgi:hypothetical protein
MYFIERLTVLSWLFFILPELRRSQSEPKKKQLYYLEASSWGLRLAGLTAQFIKFDLNPLNYTLADAKDSNGDLFWWSVLFKDLGELQDFMKHTPILAEILQKHKSDEYLNIYLTKRILYLGSTALQHFLLMIRVILKQAQEQRINMFLVSSRRPWLTEIKKWAAATRNINIIPMNVPQPLTRKEIMAQSGFLKSFAMQAMFWRIGLKKRLKGTPALKIRTDSPKMAVEYYGHLNLDSPQLNSDVFFCQSGALNKDTILYFQHPILPISDMELEQIEKHGMSAVVLNPRSAATHRVDLFNYQGRLAPAEASEIAIYKKNNSPIGKDLANHLADYYKQRDYWHHYFSKYKVKMHVSWVKGDAKHFPMADALERLGGIPIVYQKSFEYEAFPWGSTKAAVFFGFSKRGALLGKDKDSRVPYYVITGYLGDCRFSGLKKEAMRRRKELQGQGAQKILAYFDESSADDPRKDLGHNVTRENYTYLLTKVLELPWLGLVLKPKMVTSLRRRLGKDVMGLLDKALKTGRCSILDDGHIVGIYAPAAAALVSDIAIHGHLAAGTAGIEAALTGTPTLMLDREGCSISPLYNLEQGKVIFKDWDSLWQACQEHWKSSVGGFGDWSAWLNEIDPFRDGRAAERMGTYLEWLMEGLKAGLPRETVLADAAERYAKIWGKDKVLSVNGDPKKALEPWPQKSTSVIR